MSAGSSNLVVMNAENYDVSPFAVLTDSGWVPQAQFDEVYQDFYKYDLLLTKRGDVFVSGGTIPRIALIYNFENKQWKQLQSFNIDRNSHSCQNIIHGTDQK